jgi:hypothetical protein
MWVKWSGIQDADCCTTFGAVLARQGNALFSDDIIALNNADPANARVVWRQSGGPAPILITGTTIVGTNWHHIAVTFASSGSTLYVDGIPQGTASGAALNNNAGVPLSIGAWAGDGAGFSTSSIDDVAIWDQPLSATQIGTTRRAIENAAGLCRSGKRRLFRGRWPADEQRRVAQDRAATWADDLLFPQHVSIWR